VGDRLGFGAITLNKVLWFSDARAFMLRRRPITGAVYVREKYGPVPRAIIPIHDELVSGGIIRITDDRQYDYISTRFHAQRPAHDTSFIDAEDLRIVEHWIETIDKDHTAGSISEESHDYAWEITAMGEELPYHALFVTRTRQPDNQEMDWARHRAKELDLP
jgi:hypothetical protein